MQRVDITLTGLKTLSTSGSAMNIVTTGGAILDAGDVNTDVDARNGRVQLTAATGISDIETQVNNIDLYNLVSGSIVINESNNLGLFDLSSPGDVTLNAGTSITFNTDVQLDGDNGATYTFNATDNINVNQNICEGGVTCASVDDAVNITLNSTAGSVFVASGASIVTGGGNANITANAVGQEFNMADTSGLDVGAGKIVASADDMRITNLDSTNTDFDSIQLTSANRINERSGNDVATAGGVIFNVGAGIYGTVAMVDTPFEVVANEVRVTNTGAGTPVMLNIGTTGTTYQTIDVAGDFFTEAINASSDLVFNDFTNLGGSVDIIASRDIDLNASLNGAAGDISLTATSGVLTLLDAGILTANNLTMSAADLIDSDRAIVLGAGNLTLTTQSTGGNSVFNTTATSLDFTNTGTNSATINETDALTISNWSNNGDSLISAGGALTIPDAGLNEGTRSLSITATDVLDSDRTVILGAGALTLNTQTAGGDSTFTTTAASLDLTNGGTNAVTINETDALSVSALSASGDTTINATGALTIPDAGLNVGSQGLSLTASDIIDVSGRVLDITAGSLLLNTQTAGGDSSFNTTVASLDLTNGGTNAVTVNETDALSVTALTTSGDTGTQRRRRVDDS